MACLIIAKGKVENLSFDAPRIVRVSHCVSGSIPSRSLDLIEVFVVTSDHLSFQCRDDAGGSLSNSIKIVLGINFYRDDSREFRSNCCCQKTLISNVKARDVRLSNSDIG